MDIKISHVFRMFLLFFFQQTLHGGLENTTGTEQKRISDYLSQIHEFLITPPGATSCFTHFFKNKRKN